MKEKKIKKIRKITGIRKTMSTYETNIARLKNTIGLYQKNAQKHKNDLLKVNLFINKLRDEGRLSQDEIANFFNN